MGIEPGFSSAYHPETNGQTEHINQNLEQFLRCYINHQQDDWVDFLPYTEYCYNSSLHSLTGASPFQVAQGFKGKLLPGLGGDPTEGGADLTDWWLMLVSQWGSVKETLEKANADYKAQADKKRSPP